MCQNQGDRRRGKPSEITDAAGGRVCGGGCCLDDERSRSAGLLEKDERSLKDFFVLFEVALPALFLEKLSVESLLRVEENMAKRFSTSVQIQSQRQPDLRERHGMPDGTEQEM